MRPPVFSPRTIKDTVEALNQIDTLTVIMPVLCEQLDAVLERLVAIRDTAREALAVIDEIHISK
jgi:hypothetical protein